LAEICSEWVRVVAKPGREGDVATVNRKPARANALATYHLNLATITTVCPAAFALERCRPDPIGQWFRFVQHRNAFQTRVVARFGDHGDGLSGNRWAQRVGGRPIFPL
jgi:hypothetical protein